MLLAAYPQMRAITDSVGRDVDDVHGKGDRETRSQNGLQIRVSCRPRAARTRRHHREHDHSSDPCCCSYAASSSGAVVMQVEVFSRAAQAPAQSAAGAPPAIDLKALDADVTRLKALLPSNSHIMMDVRWHWTNLWFAGRAKNWPLAQFYFNETRSHIQWLIKKSPKIGSRGPDKEEVDASRRSSTRSITSSLADVKNAIAAEDSAKFAATYKTMLDSCYSCHKSVGRPYLGR